MKIPISLLVVCLDTLRTSLKIDNASGFFGFDRESRIDATRNLMKIINQVDIDVDLDNVSEKNN